MNVNLSSVLSSGFSHLKQAGILRSFTSTEKMVAFIAAAAFGLYMVYCTCRYFYYNAKAPVDGVGKRVDFFGLVYEGEFKNGRLNGKGKKEYLFGAIAEGNFVENQLNGQGKKFANNSIWFGGRWLEEGEFKNDELDGQGKRNYGEIKKYLFFGDIVPGQSWEGDFKNGRLNGHGKRTWPQGKIEEGEFEQNELHGQGKRTKFNGTVQEGTFRHGFFVG